MIGIGPEATALEISRLTRWKKQGRVARALGVVGLLCAVALLFAPWQQNAVGKGRVIAYSPNQRELQIQAPIKGRVQTWNVQEGDQVEPGEVIVELADNDPEAIARYERQRDAARRRIESAEAAIEALDRRVVSLRSVRELDLTAADAKLRMAQSKADAAKLDLEAKAAKARAAELQLERISALLEDGLESRRAYELAVRDAREAEAGRLEARAKLEGARADVATRRAARESTASAADAKIASAESKLEDARAKLAKYEQSLAKVERALARQRSLQIRAPRAGMITRVRAREKSAFVKPGEKLAVLIPDGYQRAVELEVSGVDAPLVVAGQEVRLQFEGWPAVQLGGWPEGAVGTFTGKVAFVDAKATPRGEFRAVVVPESNSDWPPPRLLRQGNLANGWVLLDEVPLGYELWRQLNGFPADLPDAAGRVGGLGAKGPKPAS